MIPKEVLQQIRRIQISTSRMVTDIFAGSYHSVFKGKGMEFDEVRQYFPGDDVRSIDWNVTARTGLPHVKKFVEERELTVMLLLDMSRSSYFGTVNKLKAQRAAELCSVLAFTAARNNDKIGLIGFTDKIEIFVPPRKGLKHILRIIREALYFKPHGRGTDIPAALEYLNRVSMRKTVTFILSDFFADDFQKALSICNKRHDVVAFTITDPAEIELPNVGLVTLTDAETGKQMLVDTSNGKYRKAYKANALARRDQRKRLFQQIKVDSIDIRTDRPYVHNLFTFFKTRGRK